MSISTDAKSEGYTGNFRTSQNWIGSAGCTLNEAKFVPPPPDALGDLLSDWERFLHESKLPPLVTAAWIHYQFEAIHPFLDGNGRIGRLLITLLLCEKNVLPGPFLYLSPFIEATRREYYDLLLAVSNEGRWEEWLQYFLNAVIRQSEDILGRAERMNALLEDWKIKIRSISPKTAYDLVQLLASNPFITARKAQNVLNASYNSVNRSIAVLERHGILSQVDEAKRDRVYVATELLRILDEAPKVNG